MIHLRKHLEMIRCKILTESFRKKNMKIIERYKSIFENDVGTENNY